MQNALNDIDGLHFFYGMSSKKSLGVAFHRFPDIKDIKDR